MNQPPIDHAPFDPGMMIPHLPGPGLSDVMGPNFLPTANMFADGELPALHHMFSPPGMTETQKMQHMSLTQGLRFKISLVYVCFTALISVVDIPRQRPGDTGGTGKEREG